MVAARYTQRLATADHDGNVDTMFDLCNQASHAYHEALLRDPPPAPPGEPRRKPPTVHGQVPSFVQGKTMARAFPEHGATTIHHNKFVKLRRQCCELRFIATHHHIQPDAIPRQLAERIAFTWAGAQVLCRKTPAKLLPGFPQGLGSDAAPLGSAAR